MQMSDFDVGDEKSLKMLALLSDDCNKIVIQELTVLIMNFFNVTDVMDISRGRRAIKTLNAYVADTRKIIRYISICSEIFRVKMEPII